MTYAGSAFLLAEPYLDPSEGLAWAKRALGWLEDVAWDRDHGGYWGSYHRDNERYPVGARLLTADRRDILGSTPGFKEVNTLSDAIEMLRLFAESDAEKRCAERLAELIDLLVDRLVDANGVMPYLWWPDWRPAPDLVRVGYKFATARRMLEAARRMEGAGAAIATAASSLIFVWRLPGIHREASATPSRQMAALGLQQVRRPISGNGGFSSRLYAPCIWWQAFSPSNRRVVPSIGRRATNNGTSCASPFFDRRYQGIRELPLELEWTPWRPIISIWLTQKSKLTSVRKTHCRKDPLHEVETLLALSAN